MFSIFTHTSMCVHRRRCRRRARGPLARKYESSVCARARGSFRFCGCVCAGFPRQAYRRLPTTPTADVANNGAINATGMWKSGDVLRADNGNARQALKDVKDGAELHLDGR